MACYRVNLNLVISDLSDLRNTSILMLNVGLCHGSGGYLPTSHRRGSGLRRASPRGIYGGQSGTGSGFSPSSLGFPCQYNSTIAVQTHVILGMNNMSVEM
jgi:hypothetical protein